MLTLKRATKFRSGGPWDDDEPGEPWSVFLDELNGRRPLGP